MKTKEALQSGRFHDIGSRGGEAQSGAGAKGDEVATAQCIIPSNGL